MANTTLEQADLLALRKQIFLTGYKGGMAHLASCYSSLEMLYGLYIEKLLRYDPADPHWKDRDRFLLSKGHAGLALYAVLLKAGLIEQTMFDSYLQADARIGGEPCMRDCPWIEATTGSLGHGLSMGLGIAMALKLDNSPGRVYVMLGDGECQEGTVWEAVMTAPALGADNLIAILDCNEIQKMDFVEKTIGPTRWREKWSAFGWQVLETDGHDLEAFRQTVCQAQAATGPCLIIAHTVKGKGVSIMENNPNWHFRLPGRKEKKIFCAELGISDAELE